MVNEKKKTKCLRVGITGGIGSGKTTVCRLFMVLGIPVYDADYWAKWLVRNDPQVKSAILDLFGPEAYLPDGSYNRSYVADIVFKNKETLQTLNAIVHPAVELHSMAWHLEQARLNIPYTLKEAALLVESGSYRYLDKLIAVTAPESLRIRRVIARDGISEAAVRARMKNQMAETEKLVLADYIITNDEQRLLIPQVWDIHRQLAALSETDI